MYQYMYLWINLCPELIGPKGHFFHILLINCILLFVKITPTPNYSTEYHIHGELCLWDQQNRTTLYAIFSLITGTMHASLMFIKRSTGKWKISLQGDQWLQLLSSQCLESYIIFDEIQSWHSIFPALEICNL